MSFLEEKIRKASQDYYSGVDSGMSDEEFDKYMNKYQESHPDGELLRIGHGYEVAKDSTPGKKYDHIYGVAGSLSKAYGWKDFNSTISAGSELHASLKLDGLSVVLYYRDSILYRALTRGDGHVGIDITEVVLAILHTDRLNTDKHFTGAVRGEILMCQGDFDKFKALQPSAENPRNSAAGLINSNKVCPYLEFLSIYVYTVVGIEGSTCKEFEGVNRRHIQSWLRDNFDHIAPYEYIWIDESNYIEEMYRLRGEWYGAGIPADGIVLSDVLVEFRSSSEEMFEVVYDSQAFKFPSESAQVTVTNVEWNLTKTRRLVPVILFDAVHLAGTSVRRATGNNAKFIEDHKIDVGAVLEISKHGEIIPNVDKVLKPSLSEISIPRTCPVCGQMLSDKGVDLVCENLQCQNAIDQDILTWLTKLVPIDGLGEKLILKFLKEAYGRDVTIEKLMSRDVNIYLKTPNRGAQEALFRAMLLKLFTDEFSLKTALESLNIPRLGDKTASKLSNHPEVVRTVLESESNDPNAAYTVLRHVLGTADANAISNNLSKFARLRFIIDRIDMSKTSKTTTDADILVAITGKLSVTRAQFTKELQEHGYQVGDVNKSTKYLITDDPNSSSSKNKKADKLGVVKLTEEQFRRRYF